MISVFFSVVVYVVDLSNVVDIAAAASDDVVFLRIHSKLRYFV